MSRNNNVRVDGIDVGATQKNLIGAGGLALLVKYLSRTGFFRRVNSVLPSPGSNAGYAPEVYIKSLFALRLLYPDGPAPLSRIDEMGKSRAVRKALGVKRLPCSEAVGDWLRRMGGCERVGTLDDKTPVLGGYEDGLEQMLELFYWSAGAILEEDGRADRWGAGLRRKLHLWTEEVRRMDVYRRKGVNGLLWLYGSGVLDGGAGVGKSFALRQHRAADRVVHRVGEQAWQGCERSAH